MKLGRVEFMNTLCMIATQEFLSLRSSAYD